MFGFSLATQLFQGSAQRTWNCVTQFTNLLWYKFNHIRHPIMPRSRRRHHSRSRSRSRSHSHDRDREAKRRKIDNVDSPAQKRSVSSERQTVEDVPKLEDIQESPNEEISEAVSNPIKQIEEKLVITPKKTLSPKNLQKKLESEKKRQQKQQEREEREKKKQEEKERARLAKEQQQKEKDELKNKKAKERELKEEQKRKEKEEKEAKRKEKEKEREQEKLKKQQELEEKNREKQKIEEQKQKAAQAFVNFFVPKKAEAKIDEGKSLFMPFEVKSDMKLAPPRRAALTDEEKENLVDFLSKPEPTKSYLKELKERGKKLRRCAKTWPYEEDVVIIEEDFGICEEDKQKLKRMRVKFLKFHENKRPPYYGTWRKTSVAIKGRRPLIEDKGFFDYEADSDDDWEEEEQGESLNGSDDEEKENEAENDDYEVDNEFFVPHGHLSDDEVDDEETSKLSPESHKQKLKLLKDEFDEDMQAKTNRMKPRSIGCIWYCKDGSNVDDAIDRHLRPLAMITNGQIILQKRKDLVTNTPSRKHSKELRQELIPAFLKLIHGNVNRKDTVVEDFIDYMQNNGYVVEVSKAYLRKCLRQFAQWKKCGEEGPMLNKFCWCVEDDVKKKYSVIE